MVTNWIVAYEIKVEKVEKYKDQFKFLNEFFEKETVNIFEKIILFDEIYDDLTSFLFPPFWGKTNNGEQEEEIIPDKDDAE